MSFQNVTEKEKFNVTKDLINCEYLKNLFDFCVGNNLIKKMHYTLQGN